MADSTSGKAKIGIEAEGLDVLRQYAGDLGKVNKQLRDQAKELKALNKIQGEAVIQMKGYDKAGQQVISTFKVMDKYAKLLDTSITKLSSTQKRNSEQYASIRAEIAAYNEIKKKSEALEKAHAIALQRNQALLRSQAVSVSRAEAEAYAEQKKRIIGLEKQHAIALQANARDMKKVTAATRDLVAEAKYREKVTKAHSQALVENARRTAQVDKVKKTSTVTTKAMIKAQKDMILSTKGVERVLSILIIRRIFHQIITQMREAITTTIDFHKALTEIQTISQTAPASLDKWADSIIRVSNAWDIDLLDAANARYQILSNQVAHTAQETERFSKTAFEFAKITKTTATSAVDLLSSALNAYGDSAVNADKMSAQLFKTIELGRVRSEDISSSFGRIVVVAAQLGIELAEVGAMMAIITNKGVKASEAMTLLRGVTMKLIKPTTDMKDLFAQWGVRTGEQAIATFGLLGVMQKLEEATRGSASEIGALFGRIRATMGVTALVSDLEKFNDVLIQIRDTSAESYSKAAAMQFQTAGEQLSKELNLLKNTLVQGIGTDIVEALADYNKGIVTITNTTMFLIKAATSLGIAVGIIWSIKKLHAAGLYLAMMYRHIATLGLLKVQTISTLAATEALVAVQAIASFGITLAIWGTVVALKAMYDSAKETREALERLDEQYQELVANQVSVAEKQRTEYEKSVEAFRLMGQETLQQNAIIASSSNKMITVLEERIETEEEWIKEHQKLVEQDVKFTVDEYTKMYDILIKESERYVKQVEKVEKQRLKISEDFAKIIEETIRKKLTPAENLKRLKEQYEITKKLRVESTGSLDDKNELLQKEKELRLDIFDLEYEQVKAGRAARAQQAADNQRLTNRRLGIRGVSTRKRKVSDIVPEEMADALIKDMAEMAAAAETMHQDELTQLKEYGATALKIAEDLKKEYDGILSVFNELMKTLGKPALKGLGIDDEMLKKVQEAITEGKPLLIDTKELKTTVQELIDNLNIVEPINLTIETLKESQKALEENTKALMRTISIQTKELSAAQIRGKEAENKVGDALVIMGKTLTDSVELMKELVKAERTGKSPGQMLADAIAKGAGLRADTRIEQFLETVKFHADQLTKIDKMTADEKLLFVDSLRSLLVKMDVMTQFLDESDLFGFEVLQEAFKNNAVVIEAQVAAARESADDLIEVRATLPLLKENLDATTDMLTQIQVNAQMFSESIKLYEVSIKSLTDVQMEEFRKIINIFNMELTATTGALEQWKLDRATGKATGGSVWGTDTIPTRLTPGEFIVNQRSARQFYGMLTSINSGGAAQGGGNDYSTTVGDITIGVTGGDTSRQTLQGIVSGLRREIHRGKIAGI